MLDDGLDRVEEISREISDEESSVNTGSKSNSMSGLDSSGGGGRGGDSSHKDSSDVDIIASKVATQVFWLKATVIIVLLIAAILVATAIYISTKTSERLAFERSFEDAASKVFDTFRFNLGRNMGAIDSFSVAITSLSIDTNASWPNVTVPDFEFRAANMRELADALSIALLPLVDRAIRPGWEAYSVANAGWVNDTTEFQNSVIGRRLAAPETENGIADQIFLLENGTRKVDETDGPYFPMWQHYPVVHSVVNYDLYLNQEFHDGLQAVIDRENAVMGRVWDLNETNDVFADLFATWAEHANLGLDGPVSKLLYPVFDSLDDDHDLVAVLASVVDWRTYFGQVLPQQSVGIIAVLENDCGQVYTYEINGEEVTYIGPDDFHDEAYNDSAVTHTFKDIVESGQHRIRRIVNVDLDNMFCPYKLTVYPSDQLRERYVSNNSIIYTVCALLVFLFTGFVFLLYDYVVERRQELVMKRAVQSRAIVSSLFPAAVRDRLFRSDDEEAGVSDPQDVHANGYKKRGDPNKTRLKSFLHDATPNQEQKPSHDLRPIADLFPHTTVMFADIAGFTRWSSERDPAHVFTLLQTVYHAFDRIAKKRGVFKVETIGDCYVAVTGLPDPQDDHAVRMAKFSHECMKKMSELVIKLKETLGEDTADLCMRFGLHSGPVTAGVLRGEKSRFQLFGNTVNTAARMEHTGQRNKIQISQETADLITEAGKGHWIFQRIDDIAARGGIQTYWVEPQTTAQEAKIKNTAPTRVVVKPGAPVDNSQRLIDWNVDILKRLLKRIVADRKDKKVAADRNLNPSTRNQERTTVRDEVVESIDLPRFDKAAAKTDPATVILGADVERQLRDYVTEIESMYHDNAFHSFKHASNVCTNANKMLCSIVDDDLHARTSDPLTQFAVVFSALIHDVDHQGLTNMLLIKEQPHVAALYRNKSVAEQNSVDLAWNLLMDPEYEALQRTIFSNGHEFRRFRRLVVNVVMATDIFDKELTGDRNIRWLKAFDKDARTQEFSLEKEANYRATVVIEHVMQVADIMHTMQHFHSYQRWNERLFEEMYACYECGISKKDPSVDWYEGEIWFFDNCVIPLAQRVKDCGIFGVQGDDCLKNAVANKKEWAVKGGDIVRALVEKIELDKKPKSIIISQHEEKKDEPREREVEKKDKKPDPDKHLIEWNVDLFKRMLRQILAHRMAEGSDSKETMLNLMSAIKEGTTVRDEICRIVEFPLFDKIASKLKVDPETIVLNKPVEDQLRDYVSFIASMYRENPFHNFKHASNVSMAANKYLHRVVNDTLSKQVSHPLAQFAVTFAALVHDVDHPGVTNAQLVKERQRIAVVYNNKSVAEQNSIDLAWSVLMDSDYKDLQAAIYSNQEELERFRCLVINAVMATDLFDEELIAQRNERFLQAFSYDHRDTTLSDQQQQNLRATVVMEHAMQASDIGHTMQHFHSYRRWNERLFFEMYAAYENGRLDSDPSKSWYEGEIQFFDKFVIPLAKKLKQCNMFGIAGDDALGCAQSNRKEWVVKGVSIVAEMKKKYQDQRREGSLCANEQRKERTKKDFGGEENLWRSQ